jgi:phosphate transport system permease protein
VLVVNKNNPVDKLNPSQIKDIFDQKITNWKTLGGKDDTLLTFTINDVNNYFFEEELGENFEFLPAKILWLLICRNC